MNELEMRALYQRLVALRSDPARTECVAPEQIVALAEGTLAEAERLRLLRHVSACSFCQRDLSVARTVALAGRPARSAGVGRWAGLAAAAAVLVAVLVWRPANTDRSDVMRSGDAPMTLVSPSGIITSTDSTFTWRSVSRAMRYQVEVLTAAGTVVHSTQTVDTTLALPRALLTPPRVLLARNCFSRRWFQSRVARRPVRGARTLS